MSKEIRTEIKINASVEEVWFILTDFPNYTTWNPFIKSITGEMTIGKKFKTTIEPPDAKGMTFSPKLLVFEANKEFRWKGHFIIPGLFDGEHKFELIKNPDGTTTFIQSEKFNGILVPIFAKMLDNNTLKGFNLMNMKLKELAEKS